MASFAFHRNVKWNRPDHDLDSESDDELFLINDSWPRFIVLSSASEEKPLSKLSPFAVQKGFQAIAGTLKSTRRLRDGSILVECSRRAQAENLLKTVTFVNRPVHVRVHKTLNSHRGAPEGRPGMSDVSPLSGISGLSFDSTLLSHLLFFCLVLLPFLSNRFLPAGPFF